jgi:hypothetical protein
LTFGTPLGLEKRQLLPRFHAFRDDAKADALGHAGAGDVKLVVADVVGRDERRDDLPRAGDRSF